MPETFNELLMRIIPTVFILLLYQVYTSLRIINEHENLNQSVLLTSVGKLLFFIRLDH